LIFEMAEEFDELLDDEITTVTLTYTDDLIVPEIADREGIHILERAGNQLVLEYSCSVKEVILSTLLWRKEKKSPLWKCSLPVPTMKK